MRTMLLIFFSPWFCSALSQLINCLFFREMTLKLAFFSKYVNLDNECYLFHQKSSKGQKLVVEIGKYLILNSGVAQIRFYLVILWKSQEISLLIKVFCLLSDYSKTCTKCRSTIEDLFHKVSLKLVKRWRIFINGEFQKYLLRKIRLSWIWATPGRFIPFLDKKGIFSNFSSEDIFFLKNLANKKSFVTKLKLTRL